MKIKFESNHDLLGKSRYALLYDCNWFERRAIRKKMNARPGRSIDDLWEICKTPANDFIVRKRKNG